MRWMTLSTLAFATLLAPAQATETARIGDPAAGHALAEEMCSRCHAVGETGASPNPDAPEFREVVTRYPVDSLQEALAEGIVVAHDAEMPEFELQPRQIDNLLAYLDTLAGR